MTTDTHGDVNGATYEGLDGAAVTPIVTDWAGKRLWVVLDENGEEVAEGMAASTSEAMLGLFAALGEQPADAEVYGLVLNCDTGGVARFDRVRPGCYWTRRLG